jgi:hypothetical protein
MSAINTAVLAMVMAYGAQAQGAFDRACPIGSIDAYFAALATNYPSALPLSRTFWESAVRTACFLDIVHAVLVNLAEETPTGSPPNYSRGRDGNGLRSSAI